MINIYINFCYHESSTVEWNRLKYEPYLVLPPPLSLSDMINCWSSALVSCWTVWSWNELSCWATCLCSAFTRSSCWSTCLCSAFARSSFSRAWPFLTRLPHLFHHGLVWITGATSIRCFTSSGLNQTNPVQWPQRPPFQVLSKTISKSSDPKLGITTKWSIFIVALAAALALAHIVDVCFPLTLLDADWGITELATIFI